MRLAGRQNLRPTVHKKSILKKISEGWQLYLMILPTVIFVFIVAYIPMYGIRIAFINYRPSKGIFGSEWVGFDYFVKFVKNRNFWPMIKNTLSITLYGFATFPLAIIFSLLINEIQSSAFKKTVQMVSYAPHFISTVVVCSMIVVFTNKNTGIINNIVAALGGNRKAFLEDPACFAHIYVWSGVWQGLGWGTIIYLAALSGISPELIESARIDGANRIHIIWYINIPSILPTVIIMLIMSCGGLLGVGFDKIFLLQNDLNLEVSEVLSTYIYRTGILSSQYSYSTAISFFLTVINVILVFTVNTVSKKVAEVSLW